MEALYGIPLGMATADPGEPDLRAKRQRMALPPATAYGDTMDLPSTAQLDDIFEGRDGEFSMSMEDGAAMTMATANIRPVPRADGLHRKWDAEGTMLFVLCEGFPDPAKYKSALRPSLSYQNRAIARGFTNVVSLATLNRYNQAVLDAITPAEYNTWDKDSPEYKSMDKKRHATIREISKYVRFYGIVAASNPEVTSTGGRRPDGEFSVAYKGHANIPAGFKYVEDYENAPPAEKIGEDAMEPGDPDERMRAPFRDTKDKSSVLLAGDYLFVFLNDDDHQWYPCFSHMPVTSNTLDRRLNPTKKGYERHFFSIGRVVQHPGDSIDLPPDTFMHTELEDIANMAGRHMQITMGDV